MDEPYRRVGNIAAKVYAVLVLLFGLAFLALAFILFGAVHVSEAAIYPAVPGLVLVVLSVFTWRGAAWAMILVAAFALGLVVFVAQVDRGFLALLVIPAIFLALMAIYIGCSTKNPAA